MEFHDFSMYSCRSSSNNYSNRFNHILLNMKKLNKSNIENNYREVQFNNINKINMQNSKKKNQEEEQTKKIFSKIKNLSFYNSRTNYSLTNRNCDWRYNEKGKKEKDLKEKSNPDRKNKTITYRVNNRDTRFNNIEFNEYLEEEKRRTIKLNDKRRKLLNYQEVNKPSSNLVREINKPLISFITKTTRYKDRKNKSKNKIIPPRIITVINHFCFFTKEKEKKKKKKIKKKIKYNYNKNIVRKFEKRTTFSSMNSNQSRITSKSKSNPKNKKILKNTNIKPKITTTKKTITILSKHRSGSSMPKIEPKQKKEEEKGSSKSLIKSKKSILENIKRKRGNSFFSDKQTNENKKDTNENKIDIRKNILENYNQKRLSRIKSERNEIHLGLKEKMNLNNSILEDKKDSFIGNEGKNNNFKDFLDEQKMKRNNCIRNYIKQQGISSYNFFYPKEPSPLYSIFHKKYNNNYNYNYKIKNNYPNLYSERKGHIIIRNINYFNMDNNIFGTKKIKINPKKIKSLSQKIDMSETQKIELKKKIIDNYHIVYKHYGSERYCPMCINFKNKTHKEEEKTCTNCSRSFKNSNYNINIKDLSPRLKTPRTLYMKNSHSNSFSDFRKTTSSKKKEYIDDSSNIEKTFVFLLNYFKN